MPERPISIDPNSAQTATREAWLLQATEHLRQWFAEKGYTTPHCRVSCGFASTGVRSGHIGQCWARSASADGVNQIFISPALGDAVEVLDTLVHELVHAVDDCQHKHGKEFKKIALRMGLKGPMRSASAGPELRAKLEQLCAVLGPYPHGELRVAKRTSARASRPRARCDQCGFTVPMLKKFLHFGPPLCPEHRSAMTPLGDWDNF